MGCVYILENPAMPDLIKIGFTTKTAEERARELYQGRHGVPGPFIVVHREVCEEPQKLEAAVHKKLSNYRINKDREFFKCPADDAYQLLKDLHKKNQQQRIPLLSWEKIRSLLNWQKIKVPVGIGIIANLLWDFLKSLPANILNLFRQIFGLP